MAQQCPLFIDVGLLPCVLLLKYNYIAHNTAGNYSFYSGRHHATFVEYTEGSHALFKKEHGYPLCILQMWNDAVRNILYLILAK